MRRADRLFQIVQYLRGGRLVTAASLAARLEVSERTIYRDIADLQSTGVPVDGEAGVGYVMRGGFELPPLMFTRDEIVALVAGARMVRSWGGIAMARAAEEALVKIEAVIPQGDRGRALEAKIFANGYGMSEAVRADVDTAERAIEDSAVLAFAYTDENGAATTREVHPLGLWFWGKVWTLVAWCELRDDFRMFRLDRIGQLHLAGRTFKKSPERALATFMRQLETCQRERPRPITPPRESDP
ncbi:YafY family protein [Acuticoccus sp. MNP-M23]|uniref:helix-turn-helix transcriptional regulator n=1 Tax=Acuticoccus sp. MNP-M23 TaxID=3072793 RepID=UPI0028165C60|nr:YafY family protein [Acuticoccus sp. MNP-M23]WMS42498.1 YafY family protein [Acuticoccus sp. MNP-M23]